MASKKQETVQHSEIAPKVTQGEDSLEVVQEQESSFKEQCKAINELVNVLKSNLKELQVQMIELKSTHKAELDSLKKKKRRNVTSESGSKVGFKPVNVSAPLSKFLKLDVAQPHLRQNITKGVYQYIKDNNLYFEGQNKNVMNPDSKLTKLLGPFDLHTRPKDSSSDTGLSIFNIQTYLKKHMTTVHIEQTV